MQSVPITTKVLCSNPVHGAVYLIQYYVIKFVSDLRQVVGFLRVLRFPPPIKLKLALSTINHQPRTSKQFSLRLYLLYQRILTLLKAAEQSWYFAITTNVLIISTWKIVWEYNTVHYKPLVPSIFIYDLRERKLFQNDGHDANFLCDNDVKSKTKRRLN